jgi:HTH-type transcriptional regulator, competence development regulator
VTGRAEAAVGVRPSLGQHLAAIRKDRGLSLRQVEELTKKQISNPYLNQIETGKIQQPSPNILYTLAEIYRTNYQTLMELAGYATDTRPETPSKGRISTLSELNLSDGEERELLQYLHFIRSKKAGASS